eukprot:TRINITY_DN27315_c0_g1_i3.p2 TRINITY_DN27315_c0_g1~~TRINITY_DN27315_c0_g1_i3.p2  ORF type:complete len:215 (-),score=63.59 TRINITY_DN27315_c0_g1_i3:154-798(-)
MAEEALSKQESLSPRRRKLRERRSPQDSPASPESAGPHCSRIKSPDKELMRKLHADKALTEAEVEDLRSENEQLLKALERERTLRKDGSRTTADTIAGAQAEVAVLKGQCKGLASQLKQIEMEKEAALQAAAEEHEETQRELSGLQAWLMNQNVQQEQERTMNEQSIVASRSQRDNLQSEKTMLVSARRVAEEQVATVTQQVQQAGRELSLIHI